MSIKVHIDNWLHKAELDYYTMFIKAWIPLNAWFYNEYSTKRDKEALNQIKNTKNKIRNRIEALLNNNDPVANNFKLRLAGLHTELENRGILNYGKLITFKSVVIEGVMSLPATDRDKKGNIYKAIPNKATGYRAIIVDKNNKTLFDRNFPDYDFNAFITDNQYISLSDSKVKDRIRKCFEAIDPDRAFDLTAKSKTKGSYIELDLVSKIRFINDSELIAKALVQILYALRCVLFHGELDPTDINQTIYEHAYHILKPIIKELK
jgi:hypothetical protein